MIALSKVHKKVRKLDFLSSTSLRIISSLKEFQSCVIM